MRPTGKTYKTLKGEVDNLQFFVLRKLAKVKNAGDVDHLKRELDRFQSEFKSECYSSEMLTSYQSEKLIQDSFTKWIQLKGFLDEVKRIL